MDLNHALNLNNQSYDNIDRRKNQVNNNFSDRVFAINPMTIKYDHNATSFHQNHNQSFLPPAPNQSMGSLPNQSLSMAYPNQMDSNPPVDYSLMSPAYLQMKHNQEMQNSMTSPNFNLSSIDKLKQEQARQLQHSLNHQQTAQWGPNGIDSLNAQQYAQASNLKGNNTQKTYAYNAQGEAVSDASTLYQDQHNKYKMLKEMSPEMLNRLYGRQSDQSVIPVNLETAQGDIYEQTSCYKAPQWNPAKTQELKSLLEKRQEEILKQKSRQGIQSYNNLNYGTNLNEAFSSNQS